MPELSLRHPSSFLSRCLLCPVSVCLRAHGLLGRRCPQYVLTLCAHTSLPVFALCFRCIDAQDELVNVLVASGNSRSSLPPAEAKSAELVARGDLISGVATWDEGVAKAAHEAPAAWELLEDEEDWASRPRGYSSMAESRETRRSSTSDMNFEEDRARCLTSADPDGFDGDSTRRAPNEISAWKWESPDKKGEGDKGASLEPSVNGVRPLSTSKRMPGRGSYGWH